MLAAVPDSRCVVLTTFDEDEYVEAALRAGVSGFLLKVAPPEQLIDGVRTVAAGGGLLDPAVTAAGDRVVRLGAARAGPGAAARARHAHRAGARRAAPGRPGPVQRRDRRRALPRRDDGEDPLSRMLTKLGLRDRVQAVAFAFRSGLVPLQPMDS